MSVLLRRAFLAALVACASPSAGTAQPKGATEGKDPNGKAKTVDATNIRLAWRLLSASLLSGTNNGFTMTCKDAGLTSFAVNVAGPTGQSSSTTTIKCPSDSTGDDVVLDLPNKGKGPFTLTATAAGKPKLRSERVRDVGGGDWVTLRIYINGCDSDACR